MTFDPHRPVATGSTRRELNEARNPLAPDDLPSCPFCHSADVEPLSPFGAQLMTEQYYCEACRTPFEHVRDATSTQRI